MDDCIEKNIDHVRASVNKCSLKLVEILCSIEGQLHIDVFGQSVFNEFPLDIGRVNPSGTYLCFLGSMLHPMEIL